MTTPPSSYASIVFATLIILCGVQSDASAQTNEDSKILFLHLKLQANKILQLVSSVTRPGELKQSVNTEITDGIHYEVLDSAGKPLWHSVVTDPGQRVFEHVDHSNTGKLKQLWIEQPEPEFMIRVPVNTNAVRVEFYRVTAATTNQPSTKIRIGVIPLPRK